MKQKTCKWCKQKYSPIRQKQVCCSPECAESYAVKVRAKEERINGLEARKTIRIQKEKLKTRSDWIKEAQIAVNAYIRFRDKDKNCISCGCSLRSDSIGGDFDAGHYRSRGSSPHLRFDERNIHGQCKRCNRWLSGNVAGFRDGLVFRFGFKFVQELEADNEPRKWTIEELKSIRDEYRNKLKELKCKS